MTKSILYILLFCLLSLESNAQIFLQAGTRGRTMSGIFGKIFFNLPKTNPDEITGRLINIRVDNGAMLGGSISPDGTKLLVGTNNPEIEVIDIKSGDYKRIQMGCNGPWSPYFAETGDKAVVGCGDDWDQSRLAIAVVDQQGVIINKIPISTGDGTVTAKPNSSGALIAAVYENDKENGVTVERIESGIRIYDAHTSGVLTQFITNTHIDEIEFSPNENQLLSIDRTGKVVIYDIHSRTKTELEFGLMSAAHFSFDGSKIVLNSGTDIYIIDAHTLKEVRQISLNGYSEDISISKSPILLWSTHHSPERDHYRVDVTAYDVNKNSIIYSSTLNTVGLWMAKVSPDGKTAVTSGEDENHLRVIDLVTGKITHVIRIQSDMDDEGIQFSANSRTLCIITSNVVQIIDL